jgi:hypothetical protein
MVTFLASDTVFSSTAHLPGWVRLTIGIGLLLASAGLYEIDKRLDTDFLGMVAFLAGLTGFVIVCGAL